MKNSHTFELELIYPISSKKLPVAWIEVESEGGTFVVGPLHSNLVAVLKPAGRLRYKTPQNLEVEMEVNSGIISIVNGRASILLNA